MLLPDHARFGDLEEPMKLWFGKPLPPGSALAQCLSCFQSAICHAQLAIALDDALDLLRP